jgi:hypothetical protein
MSAGESIVIGGAPECVRDSDSWDVLGAGSSIDGRVCMTDEGVDLGVDVTGTFSTVDEGNTIANVQIEAGGGVSELRTATQELRNNLEQLFGELPGDLEIPSPTQLVPSSFRANTFSIVIEDTEPGAEVEGPSPGFPLDLRVEPTGEPLSFEAGGETTVGFERRVLEIPTNATNILDRIPESIPVEMTITPAGFINNLLGSEKTLQFGVPISYFVTIREVEYGCQDEYPSVFDLADELRDEISTIRDDFETKLEEAREKARNLSSQDRTVQDIVQGNVNIRNPVEIWQDANDRINEIPSRVRDIADEARNLVEEAESARDIADNLESRVDDLRDRLSQAGCLSDLRDRFQQALDRFRNFIEPNIPELRNLADFLSNITPNNIEARVEGLTDCAREFTDIQSGVEDVQSSIQSLEEGVGTADVGGLEDRLQTLQARAREEVGDNECSQLFQERASDLESQLRDMDVGERARDTARDTIDRGRDAIEELSDDLLGRADSFNAAVDEIAATPFIERDRGRVQDLISEGESIIRDLEASDPRAPNRSQAMAKVRTNISQLRRLPVASEQSIQCGDQYPQIESRLDSLDEMTQNVTRDIGQGVLQDLESVERNAAEAIATLDSGRCKRQFERRLRSTNRTIDTTLSPIRITSDIVNESRQRRQDLIDELLGS